MDNGTERKSRRAKAGIGTGTGNGTGNDTGIGIDSSGGNFDTRIERETGNTAEQESTEKNETFGENISIEEVKPKRKYTKRNTEADPIQTKTRTRKSTDDDVEINQLAVTIIESMMVARYGKAAELTKQEKEILDTNVDSLMRKAGISKKLKNSPLVNIAMIVYVFGSVGFRVRAENIKNAMNEDFTNEVINSVEQQNHPVSGINITDAFNR